MARIHPEVQDKQSDKNNSSFEIIDDELFSSEEDGYNEPKPEVNKPYLRINKLEEIEKKDADVQCENNEIKEIIVENDKEIRPEIKKKSTIFKILKVVCMIGCIFIIGTLMDYLGFSQKDKIIRKFENFILDNNEYLERYVQNKIDVSLRELTSKIDDLELRIFELERENNILKMNLEFTNNVNEPTITADYPLDYDLINSVIWWNNNPTMIYPFESLTKMLNNSFNVEVYTNGLTSAIYCNIDTHNGYSIIAQFKIDQTTETITLPEVNRFMFASQDIISTDDIPEILKYIFPTKMNEFELDYLYEIDIEPVIQYLPRVMNTFIVHLVEFTQLQFENTIKNASHLEYLSLDFCNIDIIQEFDFQISQPYKIKKIDINCVSGASNDEETFEAIVLGISKCSLKKSLQSISIDPLCISAKKARKILSKYGLSHIKI